MKRDKLTSRKLGTVKFPPQRDNDDYKISPSSETIETSASLLDQSAAKISCARWIGIGSQWLKNWREIFEPITFRQSLEHCSINWQI